MEIVKEARAGGLHVRHLSPDRIRIRIAHAPQRL
jgi:hypothetical protein